MSRANLLNLAANRSRYPGELEAPNFDEVQAFRNAAAMIRQTVRSALQLEDIP